jgi:hypothetical protein
MLGRSPDSNPGLQVYSLVLLPPLLPHMEKWRHGDMEAWTWIHGHGDMGMETWAWRHGHKEMNMETWTWRREHGNMNMETWN